MSENMAATDENSSALRGFGGVEGNDLRVSGITLTSWDVSREFAAGNITPWISMWMLSSLRSVGRVIMIDEGQGA